MNKLLAPIATVLICFCFLASVDRTNQKMIFCNEAEDGRKSLAEFKFEGADLLKPWEKDDKECTSECSYWRIWKLLPEDIICVEIKYNFGNEEI